MDSSSEDFVGLLVLDGQRGFEYSSLGLSVPRLAAANLVSRPKVVRGV